MSESAPELSESVHHDEDVGMPIDAKQYMQSPPQKRMDFVGEKVVSKRNTFGLIDRIRHAATEDKKFASRYSNVNE